VSVAQKEDDEQGIDEQDIFDGVISLLPAITRCLFNRVLGADDPPITTGSCGRGMSMVHSCSPR
jgi:hypothetical protein